MKVGAIYPQTELGGDVGAVEAFAQAAEEMGYDHLVIYDHVLGADPGDQARAEPQPGAADGNVRWTTADRLGERVHVLQPAADLLAVEVDRRTADGDHVEVGWGGHGTQSKPERSAIGIEIDILLLCQRRMNVPIKPE